MDVTIDLNVKILPQLVIFSAITERVTGGGPYIETYCCVVADADELHAEIGTWFQTIEANGYRIVEAAVRHVPKSVYRQLIPTAPTR